MGNGEWGLCEGRWRVNVSASNSNKVLDSTAMNLRKLKQDPSREPRRRHIFDTCGAEGAQDPRIPGCQDARISGRGM